MNFFTLCPIHYLYKSTDDCGLVMGKGHPGQVKGSQGKGSSQRKEAIYASEASTRPPTKIAGQALLLLVWIKAIAQTIAK